jgi:hypothetical protein
VDYKDVRDVKDFNFFERTDFKLQILFNKLSN